MNHIKHLEPVARKAHICQYCQCAINVGEKYNRDTLVYDGRIYDWVSHQECTALASKLDMFDEYDDCGLASDGFNECVREAISENLDESEEAALYREKCTLIERVNYLLKIL